MLQTLVDCQVGAVSFFSSVLACIQENCYYFLFDAGFDKLLWSLLFPFKSETSSQRFRCPFCLCYNPHCIHSSVFISLPTCPPATNILDTVCSSQHPLFFIHLVYFPFLFTYLSNYKFFRVRIMNTYIYICIYISIVCLNLHCVFINSGHSACAITTMHIRYISPQTELS